MGHQEVTEHEVRALLADLFHPLFPVFRHGNAGAKMSQQRVREVAAIGMILDDQDGHALQGHEPGYPGWPARVTFPDMSSIWW